MLFSHICWMENYKNPILDGIMQILFSIRSHFHHEKEREGKFLFLWSAQDGWKHHPKDQMQVLMRSKSSMKYAVDKLNNSFQYLITLCWQTNFLLQGEKFTIFPILMMNVIYEKKQICTKSICMFESL